MSAPLTTFRDAAWALSPARFRTDRAAKFLYSLVIPFDVTADAAEQATKARFPDLCAEDALPFHGRDRGIRRGPAEGAASYRERLLLWIETWRGAGVGRAMLDQLAGFVSPRACRVRLISQHGTVYTREAGGAFSVARAAGAWDWDGQTSLWSRFAVVLCPGADLWERDGTWGDGSTWGDSGGTWGSTATVEEVAGVRAIISDWKPAADVCEAIAVALDGTPFEVDRVGWPDGTWGHWSKLDAGTQVPARDDQSIYWDGVA